MSRHETLYSEKRCVWSFSAHAWTYANLVVPFNRARPAALDTQMERLELVPEGIGDDFNK